MWIAANILGPPRTAIHARFQALRPARFVSDEARAREGPKRASFKAGAMFLWVSGALMALFSLFATAMHAQSCCCTSGNHPAGAFAEPLVVH